MKLLSEDKFSISQLVRFFTIPRIKIFIWGLEAENEKLEKNFRSQFLSLNNEDKIGSIIGEDFNIEKNTIENLSNKILRNLNNKVLHNKLDNHTIYSLSSIRNSIEKNKK